MGVASCVTGYFACQFARLAGLRVIAVACERKHGQRLRAIGVGEFTLFLLVPLNFLPR